MVELSSQHFEILGLECEPRCFILMHATSSAKCFLSWTCKPSLGYSIPLCSKTGIIYPYKRRAIVHCHSWRWSVNIHHCKRLSREGLHIGKTVSVFMFGSGIEIIWKSSKNLSTWHRLEGGRTVERQVKETLQLVAFAQWRAAKTVIPSCWALSRCSVSWWFKVSQRFDLHPAPNGRNVTKNKYWRVHLHLCTQKYNVCVYVYVYVYV